MWLLQKLLNKFNGLHYPQEYLCFGQETFDQPLHAYLFDNGQVLKDITKQHAFVGYHPLILALPLKDADTETIEILFSDKILQPNDFFSQKDAIARLRLKKIKEPTFQNHAINLYEGTHGTHSFISSFHQHIIGLNNRLFNRKKGNVFLDDNLYKQVQIAYALPRNISLITVSQNNSFNLFPTDLHGQGEEHYIISLRFSGKACHQVENSGRIVLSRMQADSYKTVYQLGKNHMQDLKPKENFPFGEHVSPLFQLPVPAAAHSYRELELLESFERGIHKLMLFKVLTSQQIRNNPSTLAHVHNTYATWRYNNHLTGNYLLR